MLEIQKLILSYYESKELTDRYYRILERIAVRSLVISTLGRKMGKLTGEDQDSRESKYREIKSFIRKTYPSYRSNPYLTITEKIYASVLLQSVMFAKISWGIIPKVVKR